MKHEIHVTFACVIAILLMSTTAFADILTDGDTHVRTAGPAISVDGHWYESEAHSDAVGDDYWGYGGWRAWNFTYTTETGTFDWYSYLWVKAMCRIECFDEGTTAAYAHAEAIVNGPAPNNLGGYITATVDLSYEGEEGKDHYDAQSDEPYPAGYAGYYEEGVEIEAMDGVYCLHVSYVDASIVEDDNDRAYADAWAEASAYIQYP